MRKAPSKKASGVPSKTDTRRHGPAFTGSPGTVTSPQHPGSKTTSAASKYGPGGKVQKPPSKKSRGIPVATAKKKRPVRKGKGERTAKP